MCKKGTEQHEVVLPSLHSLFMKPTFTSKASLVRNSSASRVKKTEETHTNVPAVAMFHEKATRLGTRLVLVMGHAQAGFSGFKCSTILIFICRSSACVSKMARIHTFLQFRSSTLQMGY